jgi:hypothetical protein
MLRPSIVASLTLHGSWVALALAVALVTAGLLGWNVSARRAYAASKAVIFARSPWPLVLPAVVLVACTLVAAFIAIPPDDVALVFLPAFFAAIFYVAGVVGSLTLYVADSTGLTWQLLSIRLTMAWQTIDWIYSEQRAAIYNLYGIRLGPAQEQALVVEAGPRRRIRIPLQVPVIGARPDALVDSIRRHATAAVVGFDQRRIVEQRRASVAAPGLH